MGQKIITVRGRTFAVESKSGNQTAFIIREFEKRTDQQLDGYVVEFESDRDALVSAIGFKS